MKKIIFLLAIFFFSFFLLFGVSSSKTFAASNFTDDYDVTYTIAKSGTTHAVFNVTLTNTSSQYYASSYKILLGFSDIENLKASDDNGSITPDVTDEQNGKSVQLTFNKRVVGVGNKLNFSVAFDTSEIAQNEQNIWEVNIPGISRQNDFASFNVHVITPGLGSPTIIKPSYPQAVTGKDTLLFTKDELGTSGISLTFGDKQAYNYNLVYHLHNQNLFPIQTDIALPPETNYQQVLLNNLSPKPQNVRVDQDGNWLATYQLSPSQKIDVTAEGTVQTTLTPKREPLTDAEKKLYLQKQPYWQTTDAKIVSLAQNLKTPQAIYDYVVKTLSYNYGKVSQNQARLGAAGVLQNPTDAVCLEFTDLFVTLSRAAGIPAREVDGFAYTKNSRQRPLSLVTDVLHAWPEYYDNDKQTWIMVDPTWGNTTAGVDYFNTLDFDHVAFAIKGADSSYPVPAGGYKYDSNINSKDVTMTFGKTFTTVVPRVGLSSNFPATAFSGFPIEGSINVANTGQSLINSAAITVTSDTLSPGKQTVVVKNLPPYGHDTFPVSFDKTSFLTNRADTITIALADTKVSETISVSPFFTQPVYVIGGVIFAILITLLIIAAFKARHLSFFRKKPEDPLRGQSKKSQEPGEFLLPKKR